MSDYEVWSICLQSAVLLTVLATVLVYRKQAKTMTRQLKIASAQQNREAHAALLSIAIQNDDALEVWRASHEPYSAAQMRQHLFVNLAISNLETSYEIGRVDDGQVLANLRTHSKNPYYRAYWAEARPTRVDWKRGARNEDFFRLCDSLLGSSDAATAQIETEKESSMPDTVVRNQPSELDEGSQCVGGDNTEGFLPEIVSLVLSDNPQDADQCIGGDNTSSCDCDSGDCMCDTD